MTGFSDSLLLPGLEAYAAAHSDVELPVLARLNRSTHLRTHQPQMLSGHLQGTFLQMISQMIRPQQVLEIGTFTGYSAICLAQGLQQGGKLITIDCNPEMTEFALPFFAEAGLSDAIHAMTGDARELIPQLEGPFDLVFIDADKDNYVTYLEQVIPKVRPGGFILADNTLWYGRVIAEGAETDRETAGIRTFNEHVTQREGISRVLLPIRDGITLIRKNQD
jgi:caffeoyl-CoA O-methyltransferase